MSSVTQLSQQQQDCYDEALRLNTLALAPETDADLVDDLEKQSDEKMAEGDALKTRIDRAKRIENLVNDGNQPKEAEKELNLDENAETGLKITIPANVRRHEVHNFKDVVVDGMDSEHRAYAYGRFMLAAAAATLPGKFRHLSKYIGEHERDFGPMNAATEGGNAGVWVPTQFDTDLISLALRYGVARNLLNMLPMFSDKRTDPKEGSDPDPVFVGEGVAGSDLTPTDDSIVTLTARKLMAIMMYSSELNEDSVISFGDNLMRRTARGFTKKEDECAWIGDGTSTYGSMRGFNTRLTDVDDDGAGTNSAGLVTGTTGSDAAWSAFTLTDHEQVIALLPDFADQGGQDSPSAVWVCHRTYYHETMVRLMLAAGGTTAAETAEGRRRPLFLGFPVVFSNVMPKVPAASAVVATFGDHRRAANFGDRRAYTVAFSTEATIGSVGLFETDQIAAKATERFDINVHSVGDSTDAGPVCGLESQA